MLEGWQKELHQEVMQDNCALLLSLGHSIPSGAISSLMGQQEVTVEGCRPRKRPSVDGHDEEQAFPEDVVEAEGPWDLEDVTGEDVGCLSPSHSQEGEYRSSLHLCALMKLVKEIPEFLCMRFHGNEVGPIVDKAFSILCCVCLFFAGANVATNTEDALARGPLKCDSPCRARGLESRPEAEPAAVMAAVKAGAVPEQPAIHDGGEKVGDMGRLGAPGAPAGDAVSSSALEDPEEQSVALEAGRHLPKEATADLEHGTLPGCRKEGAANELDSPLGTSESISLSNGCPVEERPLPETRRGRPIYKDASRLSSPNGAQETAVEEKPLQGLLKCLKDLIVHQPLPSHQASRKVSTSRCQAAPEHKMREAVDGWVRKGDVPFRDLWFVILVKNVLRRAWACGHKGIYHMA
ncbi:UNVERIFIED_CONTAM: hypothetical protein K2H54_003028, partial [Gekko kuhli]